ncbi:hypothetical protein DFJ43DRAFT_1153893 [Lentinula guzmanii]|uniref:Hyaluronan/mRNA-binding protein domain-containing protein n=1 Tax=Lentinula guzmanii TaxID=2804957 RepID=A0AA38MUC9_9AGAR|nr:hypothetical protein DFJ43DRAFT_1153893 [Lentinula guzmanii]
MTRTARAAFPRAIIKDRSQSRSGLGKVMKKEGAGSHNWGKLGEIETVGSELDYDSEGELTMLRSTGLDSDDALQDVPTRRKRSLSVPNDKEIEAAKQLRKNALNGTVDLATIARTSVAVSSVPGKDTINSIHSDAGTTGSP